MVVGTNSKISAEKLCALLSADSFGGNYSPKCQRVAEPHDPPLKNKDRTVSVLQTNNGDAARSSSSVCFFHSHQQLYTQHSM